MKYFLDTEFLEDGKTIELISIGIVCEDGREYYAVHWNPETMMRARADPWMREHVMKHISGEAKVKEVIADDIRVFMGQHPGLIEMWADYASYDWVVFCQIFGKMIDLPKRWPKFCHDIQQAKPKGLELVKIREEYQHHALWDAKEVAMRWEQIFLGTNFVSGANR